MVTSADAPPGYEQAVGPFSQQPPGAYSQQPAGTYQAQPTGGYQQPQGGYQPPQGGYQQPQVVVTQQPMVTMTVVGGAQPPDYMVPSILVCLFCFWPTGLFAIYYSSKRNNLLSTGDVTGAHAMANNARKMMIASIVVGVVWIAFVVILRVALASNGYSGHGY